MQIGPVADYENARPYSPGFQVVRPISLASSFGDTEMRWTPNVDFTATPVSSVTIGMSDTSYLFAGLPIRYVSSASGPNQYYYGLITSVSPTVIQIAGRALSGTIYLLWIGDPEICAPVDLFVPGKFAVSSGVILGSIGKTSFFWPYSEAWLCLAKAARGTAGGGLAQINIKLNGTNALPSNISANGGEVNTALVAAISYGQTIDINVTTIDTTDADLTVFMQFVLE